MYVLSCFISPRHKNLKPNGQSDPETLHFTSQAIRTPQQVMLEPFFEHCRALVQDDFAAASLMRLPVLELLKGNLQDLAVPERAQIGARHLMVFGPTAATASLLLQEELKDQPATVIFGSSFPGDKSVAAIYREIAHIKQAMEVGGCSMLVHAEDVYESLYDMLNQFYTQASGPKHKNPRNLTIRAAIPEVHSCL